MDKRKKNIRNSPKSSPKKIIIEPMAANYSIPKLYIPKNKNGKSCLKKAWYVWYNYRNPETGQFDNNSKRQVRHGINRYKTYRERKAFGESLVRVYTRLLEEGYNPFDRDKKINTAFLMRQESISCRDALISALQQKTDISKNTLSDWKYRLKVFLEYAEKTGFADADINSIETFHIISFLNHLAANGQKAKSINNFRAFLSSMWSKLANDTVARSNPVTVVKRRKEKPTKNKPFLPEEILRISEYLSENDPALLDYIRFVAFAFLRPVEVSRLRVQDVDLHNDMLTVQTKTEGRATVRIVPQLRAVLQAMNFGEKTDFIFTPSGKPGEWKNREGNDVAENTRTKFFSDRFKLLKKHFGFGSEYGIYSIRHTFVMDLYNSYINSGMTTMEAELAMLPITRHKSLSGLRNYLRDIGALLPDDYGKDFSIEL